MYLLDPSNEVVNKTYWFLFLLFLAKLGFIGTSSAVNLALIPGQLGSEREEQRASLLIESVRFQCNFHHVRMGQNVPINSFLHKKVWQDCKSKLILYVASRK